MKTKRFITNLLTLVLAFALAGTAAWAAPRPETGECRLVGTWSGWADHPWPDSDAAWLAVITPRNAKAKSGEMVMNWVWVSEQLLTLGGAAPTASRLTPGQGVWEETAENQYKYTWYAYATDSAGLPLYSLRVSGLVTATDADNVSLSYQYEIFFPGYGVPGIVAPHEMSNYTPAGVRTGVGGQTRVPLVTAP